MVLLENSISHLTFVGDMLCDLLFSFFFFPLFNITGRCIQEDATYHLHLSGLEEGTHLELFILNLLFPSTVKNLPTVGVVWKPHKTLILYHVLPWI